MKKYVTNGKQHKVAVGENTDLNDNKSESNQLFKCCCSLLCMVLFPFFFVIFGAVGFVLPLVNICYDKFHFISPNIIKELI